MYEQQPMKMSSAEALCEGENGAAFSILTIGDLPSSCEGVQHLLRITGFTSFLADGNFDYYFHGDEELYRDYVELYGSCVDYQHPWEILFLTYSLMICY